MEQFPTGLISTLRGYIVEYFSKATSIRDFVDLQRLVADLISRMLLFIPTVILAGFIVFFFYGVYWMVRIFVGGMMRRAQVQRPLAIQVNRFLRLTVMGFGFLMAADQLGVSVASLLAGLGILGVALGFAAQETVGNIIAGVTVLLTVPFRVGDFVEVSGYKGIVEEITLRITRMRTWDNLIVTIPNKEAANKVVVNYTVLDRVCLRVPFSIAYREDVEHTREALVGVMKGDDRFHDLPPPQVVVMELADSGVKMELRGWVKNPYQVLRLGLEWTEKVKKRLDEAGIRIPYPHLSLYVEQVAPPGLPEARATLAG